MLLTRIYYDLKPLLPKPLRHALRRLSVRSKLRRSHQVWPISPGSDAPPEGWQGWPKGKQFALILTHDVEGQRGFSRCRQLMELEMTLGFRSSFNFVPEGEYSLNEKLRGDLMQNGFEIAVHDLRHDGKLFRTKAQFNEAAGRINHYLREWSAVGFRAGFMMRQLEWLHELNVLYDSSTFDTDPFEPQPDGCHTIYPFWVSAPPDNHGKELNGNKCHSDSRALRPGYVEIPYTLPQDSTLFLYLREVSIDIWRRKLDWLAARGGMAMLTVHPDYLRFGGESTSIDTYPAELYVRFLQYVQERYAGAYWHPLPREVAPMFAGGRYAPATSASPI